MGKFGTYKVRGLSLAEKLTAGKSFFVGNSTANNETPTAVDDITSYGENINRPLATLDYAINQCVSNRGDTIYVLEGHAESLSSTAIVVPDVARVTIKGVGEGANRPTFSTASGTSGGNASVIGITGAGTKIENCIFRAGWAAGSSGVLISVGADDVSVENNTFDHNTTAVYFSHTVEVLEGSDRVNVDHNDFINFGTTEQAARAIDLSGTAVTHSLSITGNKFVGNWALDGVIGSSTDHTARGFMIADNYINNNSTIGGDAGIYLPSSANLNGGGGNSIINNQIISGASGSSTQLVITPYYRASGNKAFNSTGIRYNEGGLSS